MNRERSRYPRRQPFIDRLRVSEQIVQQIMDVMVPQITKDIHESVNVDVKKTAEISQFQAIEKISESVDETKLKVLRCWLGGGEKETGATQPKQAVHSTEERAGGTDEPGACQES